ncbi:MAG: zinc ribbon domain-containing protein [Acidobacteriota bacterium]|nr:zinc ribbon domain-containing protein [Acidobacteriota bacterium]
MYCTNCSADVPQGARFCAACGAGVDSEATRVATPTRSGNLAVADFNRPLAARPPAEEDDIERVIFHVRPTFLFIGIG